MAVVNRYSYRIKELKIDSYDDPDPYWFLHAVNLQPCVLLPNLRVLFWRPCLLDCPGPVSVTLLQRFLGPSLDSADLFLTSMDDATVQSFLANFLLLCPNLKSISITHDEAARWNVSQTAIDLLSQAISRHQHFERLCLHVPIDDVALTHIATSPKVKGLNLVLHPDKSRLHQFCLSPDIIPFYHVEDFFLQIWDLDFLTALLRTEGQMFRSFHFNLCSRPTIEAFSVFLDALVSPRRTSSLQSLGLHLSLVDESDEPLITTAPARLSYVTLRPLAQLSQLCELYIMFDHCLVMDDNDLISLARHWPLLRVLQVSGCGGPHEHFWQSRKRITLKGLLSLVQCCPQLHWFSLPVDATKVPADSPGRFASNPKLSCISMTEAPIREPLPVARFLHRHFPYLAEVDVTFHQPSIYRNVIIYEMAWCQVNESLKDLRGLQERLGICMLHFFPPYRAFVSPVNCNGSSLLLSVGQPGNFPLDFGDTCVRPLPLFVGGLL